jgi:type IV pilus assembly protein PilO
MNTINFNKLTLDNIGKWPVSLKIGMIISVVILLNTLGSWLFIRASTKQYTLLRAQEFILRQDFETKQHQASTLKAYRHQLRITNERYKSMLTRLLPRNDVLNVLEKISNTGKSSGVAFKSIVPQTEVIHDTYVELPIKISVIGNYMQLAIFISQLAEIKRIITLQEFTIQQLVSEKSDSDGQLEMQITAHMYRYKSE